MAQGQARQAGVWCEEDRRLCAMEDNAECGKTQIPGSSWKPK